MLQRPRLLIVDDDPNFLRLCATTARKRCLVRTADDGETAIRQLSEFLPDLIVCDLEMPGATGIELLEEVRCNPKTANLPFIMLTAHSEKDVVKQALRLGVDNYILKSEFQLSDFLTLIAYTLGRNDLAEN